MPKAKKKAVRRKGKKGGVKLGTLSDFDGIIFGEVLSEQATAQLIKEARSVNCRICNTDLVHLNFEWPGVPTHAITLGAIRSAIRQRHGGAVTRVNLYKNYAHPDHLIQAADDSTTLVDLGIEGTMPGGDEALPTITFYYDFPSETQFYDSPLVYMPPSTTQPRNDIPPQALKRQLVEGMLMRPGSWNLG